MFTPRRKLTRMTFTPMLDEGNLWQYVAPPANMHFADQTIPMQQTVPQLSRHSPILPMEGKGKKVKRATLAKSSFDSTSLPSPRKSFVPMLIQRPKPSSKRGGKPAPSPKTLLLLLHVKQAAIRPLSRFRLTTPMAKCPSQFLQRFLLQPHRQCGNCGTFTKGGVAFLMVLRGPFGPSNSSVLDSGPIS